MKWRHKLAANAKLLPIVGLCFAWLLITASTIAIAYRVASSSEARKIAANYEVADGVFERYDGKQKSFTYSFFVRAVKFSGAATSEIQRVAEMQAGEPFYIYYSPDNPRMSMPSDPEEAWHASLIKIVTCSVTLIFLLTYILGRQVFVITGKMS